ncbi:MAG: protease complex subunit PrcB family protein [Planctomycetes bacterium]|nr:protease complex subunit PrcB family protein [Planctomycetota bacterium]
MLLGFFLTLSLAPLAFAQSVPSTSLNTGDYASPALQGNYVARSAQEMRAQGLDQLLPPSATTPIDWSREMVLAVVMGRQPSGGHSIRVETVQWRVTPFTTPGGAAGGSRSLEVRVRKRSPSGFATSVLTNPFQLVKVPKTLSRVVFLDAGPTTSARAFDALALTTSSRQFGSVHAESRTVRVRRNGTAQVTRSHPLRRYPPTPAVQLDPSQIRELDRLVRNARAGSLPSVIPAPGFVTSDPFTLSVNARRPALNNLSIQGLVGAYGLLRHRLEPLISYLQTIDQYVVNQASGPQLTRGRIEVRGSAGWRSVWLVDGTTRLRVGPQSFAQTLIPLDGYTVELEGSRSAGGVAFQATKMHSPVRQRIRGIARSSAQGPILARRSSPGGPPQADLHLEGDLARLIPRAQGRRVSGDAWVFAGQANPVALLISLNGNAKRRAPLFWNNQRVNRVSSGDALKITGLNSSGHSVLVSPDSGQAGYMMTRNLSIGELNAPLHGPSITFGGGGTFGGITIRLGGSSSP